MPDEELIATLEDLLKQARGGELEGFAAATLLSDNRVGMSIAGAAWEAPSTTIGLLWQVQHELYRNKPLHATFS